ncbi:unnamed protein product [Citrullus colocynthis]|uniref:Uncharacterized protein n=1 Tax=Citrullus colocynthis TaxID=252529 RepID=A0ABP0ZB52_9ROSI
MLAIGHGSEEGELKNDGRRKRRIANESNRYRRICIESLRRRTLTLNVITLTIFKNSPEKFIHCKIPLIFFRCPNFAFPSNFSSPSTLCFCCSSTDKKAQQPTRFEVRVLWGMVWKYRWFIQSCSVT